MPRSTAGHAAGDTVVYRGGIVAVAGYLDHVNKGAVVEEYRPEDRVENCCIFDQNFHFFLFLTRISIYFCCLVFDQIQLNSSLPPDTDKWATLPKFPHVISSHAAVVFDDKIWVTGGRPYPSEAYGTRDVYAFDGNTWEKKEDLRIPRTGHGMATSQRV